MKAFRNVNLNLPGGLVSLPVSLCKATGNGDLSASVVGPNGEQLRQVYLDPNDNEVARADTQREIEGKIVTQDELKAINDSCKQTNLDILEVCPESSLNPLRVEGAYYVYANAKTGNPHALKIFVEALKKLKSVAVVKWTPTSRQQLLVLKPEGDALVGVSMAFAEDWREADEDVLSHVDEKVAAKEVAMAVQLLETVKGNEALDNEADQAIQLKKDLIAGTREAPEATPAAAPAGDDLTKQLEASLAGMKKDKAAA